MVFIIVSVIFFLDRLTKFFAVSNLSLHRTVPVIENVFHFTLVFNRGAAFGILKNQILLFIFTSLCAIVLICFQLRKNRNKKNTLQTLSLSFILAGAVGNLVDRLFLGYVIDFLDFRIWPVFNIADSAITIGVIALGYSVIKKGREGTRPSGE